MLKYLLLFATLNLPAYAAERIIKFGVVPQQSADKLLQSWTPIIDRLSRACDCKVIFYTSPDIPKFYEEVKNQEFDLVYLNPLHFVESTKAGYSSLVREKDKKLEGIIVSLKNSGITKIEDLKNQKIAFPSETSFAATILNQVNLKKNQIPFESIYVKSHESVYLNVLSGLMKAGGGINRTFEELPAEDREKLTIITRTIKVTPHPIAIHKRIDKKTKAKFLTELISLEQSEEGKNILSKLNLNNLVFAKDSDWDDVKKIALSFSKKK